MQKLRHPNVVRLFDVIQTQDRTMLIMEFLSGGMYVYMHMCVYFSSIRSFK